MKSRARDKKMWIALALLSTFLVAALFIQNKSIAFGSACLKDSEVATYEILDKKVSPGKVRIVIADNLTETQRDFEIEIPRPNHYHPVELHKCGIYTTKSLNYDFTKELPSKNYSKELLQYTYNQRERSILQLAKSEGGGSSELLYSADFRVSWDEKFLVLEEGYLGSDKYNLVIKSLIKFKTNNLKDVVVIPYKSLTTSDPDIYGSIGFNEWSDDSRYFWGNIFEGAAVQAFYRVDMQTLTSETFKAPYGTLGGDALVLNPNNGYIPYDPNAYWSPDEEDMRVRREINRAKALKSELHLYHLPSGKDIIVATTNEPLWRFTPKWISDVELEYRLPGNVTKQYILSIPAPLSAN